jgi:mono/diheme cytochrome c family protein
MKILKWIGIVLGTIIVLMGVAVGILFWRSSSIVNETYSYDIKTPVYVPTDSAAIAHGSHLVHALAMCVECHGTDFGGKLFIDGMPFATVYGPNLTFGKGGFDRSNYSVADFDRAVRHGIKKNGHGTFLMPSIHFTLLSNSDLGSIYAYIRSLPDVDRVNPPLTLGPIGKIVTALGGLKTAATHINHDGKRGTNPPEGPTAEYGKYLADVFCQGCHSPNLSGGPVYEGDPDWPPSSNLTKGGVLPHYTEDSFSHMLRTGFKQDGTLADTNAMLIRYTKNLTDDEITALWLYLQTVPSAETASMSWDTVRVP